MTYSIKWSDEAEFTLEENIAYLEEEWDLITINKFLNRIDEVLLLISRDPCLYPVFRQNDHIHRCVINKHVTLFYRIVDTANVHLITFWNNHQNPKNLRL